jgi:hypothetical protein
MPSFLLTGFGGWMSEKKTRCFVAALSATLSFAPGCARPDHVESIKGPVEGVFYTVETFHGRGAIDSDFTRVYAHLERNGKSDRQLVVDGSYLEFSRIIWASPHDVTLCMKAGLTNSFRTEVTLIVGNAAETIHNHLEEHCQ